MAFIIPNSLIFMIIASLFVLFIILQLFIDARSIRTSQKQYQQLLAIAKKQIEQSITITVSLDRNATTILQLLDHLYSYRYSHLQVIVIIKQTAGKNARPILEKYRRQQHYKNLRIVTHKAGISYSDIIRRYATGTHIVRLTSQDRLSNDFFKAISMEAIGGQNVQLPQNHIRLDNSFLSALQAHFNILGSIRGYIGMRSFTTTTDSGVVIRQAFITDNQNQNISLPISQKTYISRPAGEKRFFQYFDKLTTRTARMLMSINGLIGILILALVSVILYTLFYNEELLLLLAIVAAVYVAISVTMQFRHGGYSVVDRVNLCLTAPLSIIYVLIVVLVALIKIPGIIFSVLRQSKRLTRSSTR